MIRYIVINSVVDVVIFMAGSAFGYYLHGFFG